MWYYAFAAVVILHKYMYTVSASLQYAHSFFKMTIWGAFNSNFEHSFYPKMSTQFKFHQDAQCNDMDTVFTYFMSETKIFAFLPFL